MSLFQIIFFSIFFLCIIGVIFYVLNEKVNDAVSRIITPYQLLVLGFIIPGIYMVIVNIRTYLRPPKMGEYIIHGRFHIVFTFLFLATLAYPIILNTDKISGRIRRNYLASLIVLLLSITIYEAVHKNVINVVEVLLLLLMAVMYFFIKNKLIPTEPDNFSNPKDL